MDVLRVPDGTTAANPAFSGVRTAADRQHRTEDGAGVGSGVSLDGLIEAAQWLAGALGRELPGLVAKAGRALS